MTRVLMLKGFVGAHEASYRPGCWYIVDDALAKEWTEKKLAVPEEGVSVTMSAPEVLEYAEAEEKTPGVFPSLNYGMPEKVKEDGDA